MFGDLFHINSFMTCCLIPLGVFLRWPISIKQSNDKIWNIHSQYGVYEEGGTKHLAEFFKAQAC